MPKRKVTSAPWVPVPARAYTGKAPRARQHRAVGRLSAGAPRLHKSCRWRRPQSKGRSCRSGRARRDLRVRGGRGHLSERPGWPSGSPISRGSTVSMIAFGGRRGPHPGQLPGVAAGRSNVARLGARGASGRMPLPRAGHPTARAVKASAPLKTAARRPCVVVVVVVVVAATPNYLRQASQNLGKYLVMYRHVSHLHAWCLHGLSGLSIQYMRLYRRFSILNDTSRYMTSLSPLPRGCFACVSIQEATELPMGVNYHRRLDT